MTNLTELRNLESAYQKKFADQNTDSEENKINYHYWQDQVGFVQRQIALHEDTNKLFRDLQAIENQIAKVHAEQKDLYSSSTPAGVAFDEAHTFVQRAKTAVGFAFTGE